MEQHKNKGILSLSFVKRLVDKLMKDDAIPYAYQLAFSLVMALFPFMIFLLTLIGFMNLDPHAILAQIARVLPGEAYKLFEGIIKEVTSKQNGTLLSLSIVFAIWAASGGFKAFMQAMNKVHGIKETRSIIAFNAASILYVILLAFGIAGALLLLVFAQPIIDGLRAFFPNANLNMFQSIFSYIFPLGFIFVLFAIFYMFVPARRVKFRYAMPGAIFSALAFTLVSLGFKIYVNGFANYNRFYGSIGAVVILMFWFLLVSMIMVIGGALNSLLIERLGISEPFCAGARATPNQLSEAAKRAIREKYRETKEEDSKDARI
ncbi:Inner membrane protein YihY, formerly thought to be RNase BN [Clostridiaceae bacterium JG1575]|nr:Inner membrane protein YihY, formerly thought to be RNase BN [Clostridiaceae bacterium JG1575]